MCVSSCTNALIGMLEAVRKGMRVATVAKGKRTTGRIHKVGGQVRKESGSLFCRKSRTLPPCQSRAGLLLSYKQR